MYSNQLGWTAFLVAVASVSATPAQAVNGDGVANDAGQGPNSVESRLARLQSTLQQNTNDLQTQEWPGGLQHLALGWGNGRGGTFVDTRRGGGWGNGGGGGFGNINPWRNGWGDRGFYNRRWPNGGGFVNRW